MTVRPVTAAEIRKLFDEGRSLLHQCDWSDRDFSLHKAAFGAILAQIAYCTATEDEREAALRAKLVPSDLFQRIVAAGASFDLAAIGAESGWDARIQIVTSPTMVAVVATMGDDVFIGVRGSQFAYDWDINLDAARWVLRDDPEYFVHSGFYKETVLLSAKLYRVLLLQKHKAGMEQTVRIHLFGHSLGGAICALLKTFRIEEMDLRAYEDDFRVHDSYTYGAPRTVGPRVAVCLRNYAIRRPGDIVPSVPLHVQGYADYLEQYGCSGLDWRARNAAPARKGLFGSLPNPLKTNPLSAHMIEGYKLEILGALGLP